mmetsp:Transcript_26707/g.42310  ORF Transcript_26707/g.42310 Transcript_26707/m.42310 type:complete len:300 (-) Transcript_26707:1177-2076(-)
MLKYDMMRIIKDIGMYLHFASILLIKYLIDRFTKRLLLASRPIILQLLFCIQHRSNHGRSARMIVEIKVLFKNLGRRQIDILNLVIIARVFEQIHFHPEIQQILTILLSHKLPKMHASVHIIQYRLQRSDHILGRNLRQICHQKVRLVQRQQQGDHKEAGAAHQHQVQPQHTVINRAVSRTEADHARTIHHIDDGDNHQLLLHRERAPYQTYPVYQQYQREDLHRVKHHPYKDSTRCIVFVARFDESRQQMVARGHQVGKRDHDEWNQRHAEPANQLFVQCFTVSQCVVEIERRVCRLR